MSLAEWSFRVRDYLVLNPWAITLSMVLGFALILGLLRIRKLRMGAPKTDTPRPRAPTSKARVRRYEFRLCIVGDKHRWIETVQNSLTFTFVDKGPLIAKDPMTPMLQDQGRKYDIDPTVSYELAPSFGQRVGMFLRRIDTMFLVVFQEGETEPIKYQAPKRSAYILKTVEESTALSEGLKKEFTGEFSVKKMFMYLVLIIVGVLAYMFLSGQLVIG